MSQTEIMIFGYNDAGLNVVKQLDRRKQKFVIADYDETRVAKAQADGFKAQLVDLTEDETLRNAGLGDHVKTIFCLLEKDSANVFLAISARAIDPNLNIISIGRSEDVSRKLLAAGASKVINPYQISGRKIYEIIRKPEIVELLDDVVFGQQDLHMGEVSIEPGCRLEKKRLDDFVLSDEFNMIVLAVEDKELGNEIHFTSRGIQHKLDAGDKLIVIGPAHEIENFQRKYAQS